MSAVGAIVLVAVLALATVVGVALQRRAGRVRAAATDDTSGWALVDATPHPDDRVLLLQLSSPLCTPCRQTAAQLNELARRPGLRHVEVDIADDPEVARQLHVMRTPTTIAFARDGRELLRILGCAPPAGAARRTGHRAGRPPMIVSVLTRRRAVDHGRLAADLCPGR